MHLKAVSAAALQHLGVLPGCRDRINLKHRALVMLPCLLCMKQDLQLCFDSVPGKATENEFRFDKEYGNIQSDQMEIT